MVEPKEIDEALESDSLNLNWLEAIKTAEIINELNPSKVYLDCPSPNKTAYVSYLKNHVNNKEIEIIADHHAESKFLTVAAASIIAKVTRDDEVKKLEKKYGTIGSLPYKESVWVESNNFIFPKSIGEIVENKRADLNVLSLEKPSLNLINHKITFGFNHKKMEIYKVYFNNGMSIELSANHPLFFLSDDGMLKSKPLYKFEKGEFVAFSFLKNKNKVIRTINLLNLLKNLSTKKSPIYVKFKDFGIITKKISTGELEKIAVKNGYVRTAVYSWIKSSILPIQIIDEIGITNKILNCQLKCREHQGLPIEFPITKDFCWFLGIYLAEGSITGKYKGGVYNQDKEIVKKIINFLEKYNFGYSKNPGGVQLGSVLLNKILRSLKLGSNANNKKIPPILYNISKDNIKYLLKGIYDGDGYKDGGSQEIEIYSKELRDGIVNLELLLGNVCSLRYRKKRGSYIARRLSFSTNPLSVDNIPSNIGSYIKKLREDKKISLRGLERRYNLNRMTLSFIESQRGRNISKDTLRKINLVLNNKNLSKLIDSNLFWLQIDKVVSNKAKEVVYDLEVNPPNLQNFVGSGGVILHNSGYQHDPVTKKFIQENWEKHPEIFRKSWVTWKNHHKAKGQHKLDDF